MIPFIEKYPVRVLFGIFILSLAMHWHVLNTDLVGIHLWRQTQTQTVINNFVSEGFNIFEPKINDRAHTDRIIRMEFPVMQWTFALFYKLLGNHIAISRVLTLIMGFFSIMGMYRLSAILFNSCSTAVICAWAFCFSPVFYYYTVNPMPDNLALCCAIWSLVYYFRYVNSTALKNILLSGIFLCLATLAKLPFIVFGGVAAAYFISSRKKGESLIKSLTPIGAYSLLLLPAFAWYAAAIPTWKGNGVTKGILDTSTYTLSDITNILSGTIVSILPESLLNYGAVLFFIAGIYFFFKNKLYPHKYYLPIAFLTAGISAYYLYEINMISLVHDYYMFPFLPVLFLIVAYGGSKLLHSRVIAMRVLSILLLAILPATAFMRIDGRWNTDEPGFNAVYYQHRAELKAMIPPDAYCVVGNDISHYILLYYIDRKGWAFDSDKLNGYDLKFYISEGAQYLLTDSPVDTDELVKPFLDKLIYKKDNLSVYKLKTSGHI